MTPTHPLLQQFREAWPPAAWRDLTVVVAVSGGADSVALLRLMRHSQSGGRGRLVVAHLNHGLRGAEADRDQQFVRELAKSLQLEFQSASAEQWLPASHDPCLSPKRDGLEGELRNARYAFLTSCVERSGARHLVTAHTADDQAETVLHRILRGTGLPGLAGIPRVRPLGPGSSLVRPLLDVSRSQLQQYLASLGQTFRDDASNRSLQFTRNRLRHELMPHLRRAYNQRVDQALVRLGQLAAAAQTVIEGLVAELSDNCVFREGESITIRCEQLAGTSDYVVRELLIAIWRRQGWPQKSMSFQRWSELAQMVRTTCCPGRDLPGGVTARRDGALLRLKRSS